jgi:arylsulfatase A-like enzyme
MEELFMNVIVICLDTLRWDALGYNRHDWVRTPAIDGFARKATIFDRAYCGSFPTVPMRTDCFTGNVKWPYYGWKKLGDDELTLFQCLKEAGYYTALILDTSNMVGANLNRDFHEFHLIKKPVDDGVKPEDIKAPFPLEHARQGGRGFIRDMVRTSHYQHETDWFVTRTMTKAGEWLEDNYKRDRFFLWVDTFEIHEVWHAPDYYTEFYSPGYGEIDYMYPNYGYTDIYRPEHIERLRARYAAEVTLTDKWVGHLLRQIEEMNLLRNTMVILVSDHGMYIGEHSRTGKHTVDPEDAWPIYEEVGHIPLLVWLPKGNTPKRTDALVQPADLMATVLDICHVEGPEIYGRSWLPLLEGKTNEHWGSVFTSCHSWNGEGKIAYLPSHITVTAPRWSLITGPEPFKAELYDRWSDSQQKRNVVTHHPDIASSMNEELKRFMAQQEADEEYIKQYTNILTH